eukprot:gene9666-biopygen4285
MLRLLRTCSVLSTCRTFGRFSTCSTCSGFGSGAETNEKNGVSFSCCADTDVLAPLFPTVPTALVSAWVHPVCRSC